MALTIAIMNEKGGAAKTATAVNLAGEFVSAGKRVLLVDADPQGSAGEYLGLMNSGEDLLAATTGKLDPQELIYQTSSGIDLIPTGPEFEQIVKTNERAKEKLLLKVLQKLPLGLWDFVLIDAPGRTDTLADMVMVAADAILIPIECKNQSLTPFARLIETIKDVQEEFQRPHYVLGVVATQYKTTTNMSKDFVEVLKEKWGEYLLETVIRECTDIAEAPAENQPINVYAPKSNGAKDYHALAQEIYRKIDAHSMMENVANG